VYVVTDEESSLQEISGMSVYEAAAFDITGTSSSHAQKRLER